jgi:ElaB/YqjD/DUF883 family membrane-anchored ribosome-binding protein
MQTSPSPSLSTESTAGPAAGSPRLDTAVRGVHETVDRVAATVSPAIEHLAQRAHSATDAAQHRARQLAEAGDEWAETVRTTVRDRPLTCLAMALAAGYLVGRLSGNDRY